jgi:hypothetical protein
VLGKDHACKSMALPPRALRTPDPLQTQAAYDFDATEYEFESTPLVTSPTKEPQRLHEPLFDCIKFRTQLASYAFFKQYLGRNVVLERRVKFDDFVEFAPRVVEVFT